MVVPRRIPYSENYRTEEDALRYEAKYERRLFKRLSDRREKRLLRFLLERAGRQNRLLDMPCGAGRLSGLLSSYAKSLYEVDCSREMVKLSSAKARGYRPLLAEASAFHLPFLDGAFDMVVSVRFSHHIPRREERLEHLRELFRTSRAFVLVTFFGRESWKNRLRDFWRKLGAGKRAKFTLSLEDVAALAREWSFRVLLCRSLAPLLSGHFFMLLEKER